MFRFQPRASLGILTAGVLLIAACGGDDSSSANTATTVPTPSAETTVAQPPNEPDDSITTTAPDPAPEDPADAEVAAAAERLANHLAEPAGFVDRAPLTSTPEADKEVVFLRCSLPVCATIGENFGIAAETLGWTNTIIDFSSTDPESVIASMNQAVDQGPDAIALTGLPISAFEEPLERARQAGIPVVVGAVADAEIGGMDGNGVVGLTSGVNTTLAAAKMVADYIIVESNGAANVAIFTVQDFPIIRAQTDGLAEYFAEACSGCQVQVVNQAIADIGTVVPGAVVSVIQSDPTVDYVYFAFGDLSRGVAPALADARFDPRIVGYGPISESYQRLIDGEEAAWSGASNRATGWDLVDTLARHFVGDPMGVDDLQLLQLFTMDSPPPNSSPGIPENFEDLYAALWRIG